MHVRKKLDIGWSDLAFGLRRGLMRADPAPLQERVEALWSPAGDALACLSVRSGFDLLLRTLALPKGSEVLVSAVTIRDMVRIVEHHGLVAVPLDLDMESLAVRPGLLARGIGPRTVAILVAHLFGSRMPMEPLIRVARERGILVLEDCAQAFAGDGYRGHPESDVSLFSFGPIKTATALGGALLRVRDPALRARMRALQADYPAQPRREWLAKLAKYSGLKLLSCRRPYALFVVACRLLGADHDAIIGASARSFAGTDFFAAIRRRPAAALLALLGRRLERFDPRSIEARVRAAQELFRQMPGARRPGARACNHSHWVAPVCSADPEALLRRFWDQGFDATRGTSSLYVVPPESGEAARVMAGVLYLPVNPGMSPEDLRAIGRIVAGDPPEAIPNAPGAYSRSD